MNDQDYKTVREWYSEWQKIPTLLATAALALLAFSLTTLLSRSPSNSGLTILHTCWFCLFVSALSAGISLFTGYASFEIFTRVRLSDLLKSMSMKAPDASTKWVHLLGKASHLFAIMSLLTLLSGAIGLVFYALKTI